jgi:hypothetical protein
MQMNEDTKRQTDMKNAALRAADVYGDWPTATGCC